MVALHMGLKSARILHISPTYFGPESIVGGGERYAYDLAKAMAEKVEVAFLSFSKQPSSRKDGRLQVEHLPQQGPPSARFLKWIRWADIIHCHQIYTRCTDWAVLLGVALGKKLFATDLGGADRFAFSYHFPILRQMRAYLLLSEYSKQQWKSAPPRSRPERLEVIYGGVDWRKFGPGGSPRAGSVLFVGRIVPHKGIDVLIDALDPSTPLHVAGKVYHSEYFDLLKRKSSGKSVNFHLEASDEDLLLLYQQASVTVLPSVYDNCYGGHTEIPELLGLVLLESMSCETPVIATAVGSLPEIVEDGVNGLLVPPNNPRALGEKIGYLLSHPQIALAMGKRGRETVKTRFDWACVVERCLGAYGVNTDDPLGPLENSR